MALVVRIPVIQGWERVNDTISANTSNTRLGESE